MASRGLLAVAFIEILLHDEAIDETAAIGGEREAVFVLELFDDEAGDHFFRVGGIGEELAVF